MIKRVSFLEMTKEEWVEQRRKTIGGSDAGTVVGLNQFDSPYSLWAIKTGRVIPEDISGKESVRLGHDLEDYVARRWMEKTGKKLRRDNSFVYNTEYPFAHVQADRLVVNENAGFEAKTSSSYDVIKLLRDGEYRDSWYVQCVHGMMVTGAERWYLGVLCFGYGFFEFTIERDEAEIEALAAAERDFWEYVKNDTPPAPDGTEATTEALKTIYGSEEAAGRIDLFGREALFDERKALVEQIAALTARKDEIENIIKNDMGSFAEAACGKFSVSWKTSKGRKTFSVQGLANDHPEIDISQYYETGNPYRIFKIKEVK